MCVGCGEGSVDGESTGGADGGACSGLAVVSQWLLGGVRGAHALNIEPSAGFSFPIFLSSTLWCFLNFKFYFIEFKTVYLYFILYFLLLVCVLSWDRPAKLKHPCICSFSIPSCSRLLSVLQPTPRLCFRGCLHWNTAWSHKACLATQVCVCVFVRVCARAHMAWAQGDREKPFSCSCLHFWVLCISFLSY